MGWALERARRLHITVDGLEPGALGADRDPGDERADAPGTARTARGPGLDVPAIERRRRRPSAGGAYPRPPGTWGPSGPGARTTGSDGAPHPGLAAAPEGPSGAEPDRPGPEGAGDEPAGPARTGWARRVEAGLPDLLAAAVASGALVAPWLWLAFVIGLCLAIGVLAAGMAGVGVIRLPLHALRRLVSLLRPRSLLWAPVLTARTILLAVVLPGAVAAAAWTLDEGALGAPAAARAGVWTHGFRVAAALVCFMLVGGVGPGRARRAAAVRRGTARLTDRRVAAAAVACVTIVVFVVAAAPRASGGRLSGADGLGWLPPASRPAADRLRDRIVVAELEAAASCLTARQPAGWTTSYTVGNPLDAPDTAELILARGRPDPGDVVTAAAAAHNQLAPWVEAIELRWAGAARVQIDRERLPHDSPVTDPSSLAAASSTGRGLLEDGAGALDRRTVLRCSAGPVL
jgi:hypothetical protein